MLFVQTFGDLVNFNPPVHALVADGVFEASGRFLPLLSSSAMYTTGADALTSVPWVAGFISWSALHRIYPLKGEP